MADTDVQELSIPDQWRPAPLTLTAEEEENAAIRAAAILAERPDPMATTRHAGHWLRFGPDRAVTGCHCGFVADPGDCGWGDSVVAHLLDVGAHNHAKAEADRDVALALLDPHRAAIIRQARTLQADGRLPRNVLHVVVPADWPAAFDGAQVYGMTGTARGDVDEPTVRVKPGVEAPPPPRAAMAPRTTANPDLWGKGK